jgi:Ca2+-binding RTX toxin-like protein
MATLTVTHDETFSDGSPAIPANTTSIVFNTSADGQEARFAASQFGGSPISDSVQITGDSFNNRLQVSLSAPGSFSAAGWTFSSWTAGSDVIRLNGSSGADTITGSSQNDSITGRGGADILNGGNGNDTFEYDRADHLIAGEQVNGGSGTDTLRLVHDPTTPGSTNTSYDFTIATLSSIERLEFSLSGTVSATFADTQFVGKITTVVGSSSFFAVDNLIVNCTDGAVDLSGLTFIDWDDDADSITINGTAGQDILIGSAERDTLFGGDSNDLLQGGLGDDTLDGGAGNDVLNGAAGADTMSGGTGDDTYFVDNVDDVVSENHNEGTDTVRAPVTYTLRSGVENLTLTGTGNIDGSGNSGNNTIIGNSGINRLNGGGGDDTLDGGVGADTMIGDIGNDTFVVDDAGDVVTELANAGTDTVNASITFSLAALANVENLTLTGSANINGTGNSGANTLTGNNGSNRLDGGADNDTLDGGLGNDTLIGGAGTGDTATWASHDSLPLLPGESIRMSLGLGGADGSYTRVEIVNGVSQVVETDVLRGIESLVGTSHHEIITGNEQDNTLSGRGGNDLLAGGGGNDTVLGGADDDVYDFTGGGLGTDRFFDESGTNDRVIINSFNDILPFSPVDGTQTGRDGNDLVIVLTTGTFRIVDHFNGHQIESIATPDGQSMVLANGLIGGNGSGIIAGTHKGETLDGRGGDDFLFAGNGRDRLIGGDGDDRLSGGQGPDTFVFGPGFGHDVVTDFSHADHIEFDGGVFQNFKQVQAASHQVGADTVIALDAGNSITLLGVSLHSLHAGHFDFA